jgi:hypothetical protein
VTAAYFGSREGEPWPMMVMRVLGGRIEGGMRRERLRR